MMSDPRNHGRVTRSVQVADDAPMKLLRLAVYVLVGLAVLWPTYMVAPVAGTNFSATRLLGLLTILLALTVSFMSPMASRALLAGLAQFWRFYLLFGTLFLWRLVCDLFGATPPSSIALTLIETLTVFGIFFPVALVATTERARTVIVVVLAVMAFIALLIGVYEALTGANVSAMIASRSAVSADIVRAMMINQMRNGAYRIKSIFSHPILLSQFAGMMLPLMVHLVLHARNNLVRGVGALGALLAPFVILGTVARSGIMVALVSMAAYFGLVAFVRRSIKPGTVIAALVMAGVLAGGVTLVAEQLTSLVQGRTAIEISSSNSRDMMINRGLNAIQESPIFGYGHGQAAAYAGLVGSNNFLTIDNYYLSALLDFGYFGIFLTLWLFCEAVLIFVRAVSLGQSPKERSLLAALGATSGILFGQYVINSWDNLIYLFIALGTCMGFIVSANRRNAALASVKS